MNGNGQWDGCAVDKCAFFGVNGDRPVAGDWNGSGTDKLDGFRTSDTTRSLDVNGNAVWDGCAVDRCVATLGLAGDRPVAGDWDANGTASVGVFRSSNASWLLDANGNELVPREAGDALTERAWR